MANEPQSLVLELLRGVRADVAGVKADVAGMKTEMAGVKADLLATRKELGDQIVGLRRAVVEYHSAVIGHGVIISELEARVRRMEQHLDLPPLGAH